MEHVVNLPGAVMAAARRMPVAPRHGPVVVAEPRLSCRHPHAARARRAARHDRDGDPPDEKQIAEVGVPEVPEFLEQIVASGGHLWACRMSAEMMHLTEDALYEEVEGIISAADFIEKADGAQLLFI
jgi:hypothetical protein